MDNGTTTPRLRLYTIPMSHYAEKARFALVRVGLPWTEERHVQGPHYLTSWRVGRTPYLPILRDGSEVVCDSTAILRHLDRYLPPSRRLFTGDARAEALEDELDRELGVHTRRLVYYYGTQNRETFLEVACQGAPAWERRALSAAFSLARRFAWKRLGIHADLIDQSVAVVRRYFALADTALSGNRYLCGDRFDAADLAFACLAAPVVLPEGYGVRLPRPEDLALPFAALVRELRETVAGRFVQRVFAEERRAA